ncbi:MAG TPA: IS630 family transposase [Candidatus Dojkabacteria bacterium]|nr:IS630 family transposase [Candidatus Dojkabacteria bacterium]
MVDQQDLTKFLENIEFKRWAAVVSSVVWGKTYREIGEKLSCDHSWVGKLVKKFKEDNGQLTDRRTSNGGSNKKLTTETLDIIQEFYEENRYALNREVIAHLESSTSQTISEKSLQTAKKRLGFIGTRPKMVRDITLANISQRFSYCRKHLFDKFTNCLFTDESSIQMFENKSLVWWQPSVEDRPTIDVPPLKEKIMIWGGISRKAKTTLVVIRTDEGETINSEVYLDILKRFAAIRLNRVYGSGRWRLMHDNAKVHQANIIRNWLAEKEIRAIVHPGYSPDLNPIEKVWGIIKQKLYREAYDDIEALIGAVERAWEEIDMDLINRLIDNHIHTLGLVYNLEGHYI